MHAAKLVIKPPEQLYQPCNIKHSLRAKTIISSDQGPPFLLKAGPWCMCRPLLLACSGKRHGPHKQHHRPPCPSRAGIRWVTSEQAGKLGSAGTEQSQQFIQCACSALCPAALMLSPHILYWFMSRKLRALANKGDMVVGAWGKYV